MDSVREHLKPRTSSSSSTSSTSSNSEEPSLAAVSVKTADRNKCSRAESPGGICSMDTTGTGIISSSPSTNSQSDLNSNLSVTSSTSSVNSTSYPKSITSENTRTPGSAPCSTTRSDAAAVSVPPFPLDSSPPRNNSCVIEPTSRMLMTRSSNTSRLDSSNCPYTRSSTSFECLKSEQARLNTFHGPGGVWPVSFISPADCAKAGFFFLRDGDKVQCVFCRGVAGEWEDGDVPLTEHKRHFPRCPFICNLPVGNIPIGQEEEAARLQEVNLGAYGYDVCGPFEPAALRPYYSQDQVHVRGAQPLSNDTEDIAVSLGIQTKSGPARKNLVTQQARLKTYTGWPQSSGQTPEVMSEAGFFYIGTRDHVKCFYCDGGLRNWEEGDDPWFEHARWFANCPYVLLNKGTEYIKNATDTKPPEPMAITNSSSSDETSSENSSGDEEGVTMSSSSSCIETSSENSSEEEGNTMNDVTVIKAPATRSSSGDSDSGICAVSQESVSSDDETPGPSPTPDSNDDSSKAHLLEEEIRQLKEARQCKICMDNEVGVVFLPCGHLVSCVRCATALSHCALCRQPIKAVVRTYLS